MFWRSFLPPSLTQSHSFMSLLPPSSGAVETTEGKDSKLLQHIGNILPINTALHSSVILTHIEIKKVTMF